MDGAVLGARLAAQGHHGGLPGEVDPELARKGVRHRRTLQLIEQGREGRPAGEAGRGKAAAAVDSGKVALDRRQRLAPQEGRQNGRAHVELPSLMSQLDTVLCLKKKINTQ